MATARHDVPEFAYNLRFPAPYFQTETGLNQNYHRDYDALVGRYVQSDPMGLRGGINTYGYVEENPLMAVDPSGRLPAFLQGWPFITCKLVRTQLDWRLRR